MEGFIKRIWKWNVEFWKKEIGIKEIKITWKCSSYKANWDQRECQKYSKSKNK